MTTSQQESTIDAALVGDHVKGRMNRQSGQVSGRRFGAAVWLVTAIVVVFAGQVSVAGVAEPVCTPVDEAQALLPHVVLSTTAGEIVVELHEDAAPDAVRGLVGLIRGSAGTDISERQTDPSHGRPDGLEFDHCKPGIEIRTSSLAPDPDVRLPNQMSAEALGLDEAKVTDGAEAMSILQNELMAANLVAKRTGWTNKILQGWMDQWYETHSAEFLVGATREQVNRALGYVYEKGLRSIPVTAGAVTLVPVSPREASPRLSITLSDLPSRTGRWMVIGTVTEGLELAQTISKGPLTPEKALKYRPLQPVRIEKAEVECRRRHGGG